MAEINISERTHLLVTAGLIETLAHEIFALWDDGVGRRNVRWNVVGRKAAVKLDRLLASGLMRVR